MKKILLFVCSAFLIGFSSCSSDDEEEPEFNYRFGNTITKIEQYDRQGKLIGTEVFTYTDDEEGKWIISDYIDNEVGSITSIREYLLSKNGKTIKYFKDIGRADSESEVFNIVDNRIVSRCDTDSRDDIYNYSYSNGYLTSIGNDYARFEYSGNNLVKSIEEGTYTITYTDILDNVGFSIFDVGFNDGAIQVYPNNPFYQRGYLGKVSRNLIKSIRGNDGTNISYSYKIDNEGYILEMIEEGNYPEYMKYKFYY